MEQDIELVSDELRHINVTEPRYQPLRLDAMFLRATQWGTPSKASSALARPPSPPGQPTVYPLPRPICVTSTSDGDTPAATSPIAGLFEYMELVPHVLKWFERPGELANLALVSRAFYEIVRKKLYSHVWIRSWDPHCEEKLLSLFRILRDRPDLCTLIKTLEVRFFPLATRDTERYELDDQVTAALRQMQNLEHLVWTRDKSLHPELVQTLVNLKYLRSLEISGHSRRYYDPTVLGKMQALDELRVMMPDSTFRDALRGIIRSLADRPIGGLKGLAIVASNSPLIDDALLCDVAEQCRDLRRLTFWGCTKVTREGLYAILKEAEYLDELSADALPHSNMADLSHAPELSSLKSLSLSFSPPHRTPVHPHFTSANLPLLPPCPNLSALLLTLSADRALFPPDGLDILSQQINFSQLTKLSILNLFMGGGEVCTILALSPRLEELYLSIRGAYVLQESDLLRGDTARNLRILHVNAPERSTPVMQELQVVAGAVPTLEQIGTGTRVYAVRRRLEGDAKVVVELWRWSRTFMPGYFQNWRG